MQCAMAIVRKSAERKPLDKAAVAVCKRFRNSAGWPDRIDCGAMVHDEVTSSLDYVQQRALDTTGHPSALALLSSGPWTP